MGCGPIRVGVWGGLGVVLEGARLGFKVWRGWCEGGGTG